MADIAIDIGTETFLARFEDGAAPQSCARLRTLLP